MLIPYLLAFAEKSCLLSTNQETVSMCKVSHSIRVFKDISVDRERYTCINNHT